MLWASVPIPALSGKPAFCTEIASSAISAAIAIIVTSSRSSSSYTHPRPFQSRFFGHFSYIRSCCGTLLSISRQFPRQTSSSSIATFRTHIHKKPSVFHNSHLLSVRTDKPLSYEACEAQPMLTRKSPKQLKNAQAPQIHDMPRNPASRRASRPVREVIRNCQGIQPGAIPDLTSADGPSR